MNHDNENVPIVQVKSGSIGFDLPVSNDFQTLLTFAEAYFHLGYSVIPLLGDHDPARSKVPAVPWAAYQKQRSSLYEHQLWFAQPNVAGLGIVTGRISQLIILDFDSEPAFNDFQSKYPDLVQTHTVRSATRQLPHLYFRLPSHLSLPSQKGQGIDLLSDGRYVVAPPTTLSGQPYKVTRGGQPKPLTERDIRRIQSFLNTHKSPSPITISPTLPPAASSPAPVLPPTADDLQALYGHLAAARGRNEALFHTSLFARDHRLTVCQTQSILVPLHAHQKRGADHTNESPQQRENEALRTIKSAFSRPPRPQKSQAIQQQGYLSNSVRERLMQQKMTYVVRTYEALRQSGLRPGQTVTAAGAVKRLQGVVGRDSVLKALKAGQGNFQFFAPVSPRNTANAIAHSHFKKQSKKCFLIESKNQEKPTGGRPSPLYRLPSNRQLAQMLGVKLTRSDALEHTDLGTARKTRLALHRELIKRRAGSYSKRWLGARLGVSRRTIFTYTQLAGIRSRTMYFETTLHWKNIGCLPLDEPLQGAYLLTPRGKKYPALRQIASRLLANREPVCLKQQTANFYWYGDLEPSPLEWASSGQQQAEKQEIMENFIAQQPKVDQSFLPQITQPALPVAKSVSKPVSSPNDYRNPLNNTLQEDIATQLYDTLNQFKGADFQKLSHASARWLASTYDQTLLQKELDRIKNRVATGQIRNPVGFFISLLRSTKLR